MAQKPRNSRGNGWLKRKPSLLRPFPSLRCEELETRDTPTTFTWSGLANDGGNWSNPLNWVGGIAAPSGNPAEVDDLVFPEGPNLNAATAATTNDINGGTFNSISFSTTTPAKGYTLTGNPIVLGQAGVPGSGFLTVSPTSTGNTIQFNTTLGAGPANQFFTIGGSLTISGQLTGNSSTTLTKAGIGTLTLSADNSTYAGFITVNSDSGTLMITNANALGTTGRGTTIGTNSSLALSNVAGVINEPILLNGPGFNSAGALLNAAGNNAWNGPITLGTGSATAGVVLGAVAKTQLTITGVISDTGSGQILSKEGPGTVELDAANTYRGLTIINGGVLAIGNANALGLGGTATSGTIVNSAVAEQGQLRLQAPVGSGGFTILDEILTLNGAGQAGLINRGSLTNTNADNTWAGPVILGSPSPNGKPVTIGTGNGTLTISGVISTPNGTSSPSGSSSLTKVDAGELIFNNANTYSCPTFVAEGTLDIRDSNALGTNSATVSNGATLQLDVEAGIGGTGVSEVDAHGRNLSDDSFTHDKYRLTISNNLSIFGNGVLDPATGTRVGALYSATGINTWTSQIFEGTAGIGVDLDPRPGHPTPDSTYFVKDFSLTLNNTAGGSAIRGGGDLTKLRPGQLILPVANNSFTGKFFVESGWVTVQDNRALGAHIPGLAQTLQPGTFVSDGAAVHLRTLTPTSPPLTIDENFVLSGVGPSLPYKFISQKGALMNIGGNNVVGEDSTLSPIWFGYVALNGPTGIGVEQIAPITPGVGQDPSHLTIVGMMKDDNVTNPNAPAPGGLIKLGSGELSIEGDGTYSLANDLREGQVVARNNTALGQDSSGTASGTQTYTDTTTTVQSGANLRLDESIPIFNGGIGSGIQVSNEHLVLNSPAQQIGVAGNVSPAPSTFQVGFKNNLAGPAADLTTPLTPGLTGLEMAAAVNLLPSVKGSEVQTVVATGTAGVDKFTLTFNGQTTNPIAVGASAGAVAAQLNALTSIQQQEIQNVDTTGAVGTFTLSFNGNTTGAIPVGAAPALVQGQLNGLASIAAAGGVTVLASGTGYEVTFNANHSQPLFTASAGVVITETQTGIGGIVGVQAASTVDPITLLTTSTYTIDFSNFGADYSVTPLPDLLYQNLSQITATAVGATVVTASTYRDGVNGFVTIADSLNPAVGGGNFYTVTFGGDLANQDLGSLVIATAPNDGITPTVTTLINGSASPAQSEVQRISVVAAEETYTLTYKGQTTNPIPITAPAVQVQTELSLLSNLIADVGSVSVSRAGNIYTVVLGKASSPDVPLLVATTFAASQGTAEVTVNGATTIDGYTSEASLVSLSEDNAWRGPVSLNSVPGIGSRIATAANTRINFFGPIDDAGNTDANGSDLVKRGQGEVVLAGQNTFRGTTYIDEGIVTAANSQAFGSTVNGTDVKANAQIQIQGSLTIAGEALQLQGQGVPTASGMQDQWFNVGSASTNNVATAGNQATSARVTSVATDPTDPNVIYVATAGGGVWKSKDHGTTWVQLFDSTVDAAAVLYGGFIAVAPSDPNVVYFATGNANGGPNGSINNGQLDSYAGSGVYKSINAGATWTLVTGPGSNNPLYGLAVTKMIIDPTNSQRIYVATGTATVINNQVSQIDRNILATAVPGVYRFDGSAATPDWFNLTGMPSNNRENTPGGTDFTAPPQNAGPDDDYRIKFPQSNATWSDIALVSSGPGFGARGGNTIAGHTWVLYAALGESQQRYYVNGAGVLGQGIFNAVYRTEDPANTFAAGTGPTWWIGQGTVYPVAAPSSSEAPTTNAIPVPTTPDSRDDGPGQPAYQVGEIVFDPNHPHPAGRNEWITLSAVVTRYYNVNPADGFSNLFAVGQNMNASIRVYAVESGSSVHGGNLGPFNGLGDGVDFWPYYTVSNKNANSPYGRTNEFLDMQVSGWDGGIGTSWTAEVNAANAGFASAPFGLNPTNASPNPSLATARYDSVLISPSKTFGLVDTTPNINQQLYFGGQDEVWMTQDGLSGTPTWTAITQNANSPADYFHALYIDRSTGNLLIGSDGGLWYDTTNGNVNTTAFTNLNGNLQTVQLNAADPNPADFNQALAASYNNGLQQFNGSLAWQGINLPATGDLSRDAGDVRYDPSNPLYAFASSGGNLFRTVDGGANWDQVITVTGVSQFYPGSGPNIFPVYVDPINPRRVLIGGGSLRQSTNADAPLATFQSSFVGLNMGSVSAIGAAQYQGPFQYDPGFPLVTDKLSNTYDPDTIYVVDAAGKNVRVTKNLGVSSLTRFTAPGTSIITDIAVDPSNRDTVYITLRSGTNQATSTVFRTTNAGQTWTDITGNLPLVQTWTVAVDPRSDTVFIGNDQGVWQLPNASATGTFNWTRFGTGMPNVQVHDLVVNQTLNTLTAATYGRGMFQLLLTDYKSSPGVLRVISGNSEWTGPVTLMGETTITADGTQDIQNGIAAASLNILGVISDDTPGADHTLTKTGLGTIIFSGTNTYGGQTLVKQGVLESNNPSALGATGNITNTANTIVAAGAALELESDLQAEPILLNGRGIEFNGHFTGSLRNVANNNVYTGPLTLGTDVTIGTDSGTQLTIGADPKGVLAGQGTITDVDPISGLSQNFSIDKELAGVLVLASANVYGGETNVNQGALRVEDANALGAAGPYSGTTVLDGAQMQISRNAKTLLPTVVASEPLFLSGTGIDVTGALRNVRGDSILTGSNDNTWAGPITFTMNPGFSPQTNPGSKVAIGVDGTGIAGGQQQSVLVTGATGTFTLAFNGAPTVALPIGSTASDVQAAINALPSVFQPEVQYVDVTGTGGFTLTFNGQTTPAIPVGSSAAFVQGQLNALTSIAPGGSVSVVGIPIANGTRYMVTFSGGVLNNTNVAQITGADAGGGGAFVAVSTQQDGINGAVNVIATPAANGGTLYTVDFGPLSSPTDLALAGLPQMTANAAGGAAATVNTAIVDTLNIATAIQQNSALGSFGLIKVGDGRLTLQQANSFTGTTEVGINIGGRDFPGGSLRIQNANGLGPNATSNSVQTLSVVGASPAQTYQLQFDGQTTAALPATASASDVQTALNGLSSIGQNEQQQIQVSGTSGTYQLAFNGSTTTPLNFNATASAIQSALNALPSVRRSEIQNVLVTGSAGFFTLTFNGQTTTPLPYNASAASVAAALNILSSIAPTGGVSVVPTNPAPNQTQYQITFTGTLANANQPTITAAPFNSSTVQDGSIGASEVQTVDVFSTTGTYILTFNGLTTVPLPFNATAADVQTALNQLPSIGGLGGNVVVTQAPFGSGTQFTITFGGALANTDVNQITADGAGGPVIAVTAVQEGLAGSVAVSGSNPFTVNFGGDLAFRNLPQITGSNVTGTANATASTTRDGTGVIVSETESVNGKVLTVTFDRPLSLAQVPQLAAVGLSTGLAVNIDTPQQGGAGAIVNDGAGGASLEIDGDPTNSGASINVPRVLSINGTGVVGQANVLATPIAGGVIYTIEFDGALGNANMPPLAALGLNGATATVATLHDGAGVGANTGAEVQQIQVTGGTGNFTISFNGTTTAQLPFNATAAQVQAALNALSGIAGTAGALNNVSGLNTYSGAVTLATDASIGANPGTTLTVPVLQDPTPLTSPSIPNLPAPVFTKVGQGTVSFPNANPYGGKTLVRDGVLSIQNPQGVGTGRSEVQSFTTVGNVGAFTLGFNGQTTVPLIFGIPASGGANPNSSVQNALNALSSVKRTEIQTLQLSGSNAGSFTLTFKGQTSGSIAFTAPATGVGSVQSALQSLSTIGPGNVSVTGASPNYTITFTGTLANTDQPLIQATGSAVPLTNAQVVQSQDGLNGSATVTSIAVPGGTQYTVTFGGDLANSNLPQVNPISGLVFTNTTTPGSATTSEVQTAETFVSGAQTFSLTFPDIKTGLLYSTGNLPAGASAATVQAALMGLHSIQHDELQDVTVLGTSGTFQLTVTTPGGTQTTAPLAFNISAASLQTLLQGLPNIGNGNVLVTSNAVVGGTVYHIEFTGSLGNKNITQMIGIDNGNGASPTVTTIEDGLGGTVNVFTSGVVGDLTYLLFFGGDLANQDLPQITGASTTAASFAGAITQTDGNGPETQYVNVTGTAGTFKLTYNGSTTGNLLYTASAADVEKALNGLLSIGGNALPTQTAGFVTVTKAGSPTGPGGATYTITFGGTLADSNLPVMTSTTSPGAVVIITTGNDGPEGTTVNAGATLQLQGSMIMDREAVHLNGQGFENMGALNVSGGNVTWKSFSDTIPQQVPLFLDSDASIGTTLPTDNLTFLLPITDTGNHHDLDIYGPGTVTYASAVSPAYFAGQPYTGYTGKTTVHDGNLILSQPGGNAVLGNLIVGDGVGAPSSAVVRETIPNEVADTSNVIVNSDGFFDLNGLSDNVADLFVIGGRVDTGAAGHLGTTSISMTGGVINIGDNATVDTLASGNPGPITMNNGAAIVGGTSSTLTTNLGVPGIPAGSLTMDDSSISFTGVSGLLDVGNVVMTSVAGPSTWSFANGGTADTGALSITGGSIAFQNNGTLNANGTVTDSGAPISFGTLGLFEITDGDLILSNNASIFMDDQGRLLMNEVTIPGSIKLDHSTITFTTNGTLDGSFGELSGGTLADLSEVNFSSINFGTKGKLVVGQTTIGSVSVPLDNSTIVMGDQADMQTGDITMTGGLVSLGVGVSGGSSSLTAGNVTDVGGDFAFGDTGVFNAGIVSVTKGDVTFGETGHLNASGDVTLSDGTLSFGDGGRVDAADFTGIMGSVIQFLLNGVLSVADFKLDSSTLSMGDSAQAIASSYDVTNGSMSFGDSSTVSAAPATVGTLKLTNSSLTMGSPGLLKVNGITMTDPDTTKPASSISLGVGKSAGNTAITGDININSTLGASFSTGDNSTIDSGAIDDVGGTFNLGNANTLNAAGTVSVTDANMTFGTDGAFNTSGDLTLNNANITLGDKAAVAPQFNTQNVSMTNGSEINLGVDSVGTVLAINMTGSTISLGTGAVLTLGGDIAANSTAASPAQILGPGTLDVGSTDRTVNVLDGPNNVDLYVTSEINSSPSERLIKTGPGRLEFAPATGFPGPVAIQNGDVQVDTTIGPVDMTGAGSSLSGNGTVGVIDGAPPAGAAAFGTVNPGVNWSSNPVGILHAGVTTWGAQTPTTGTVFSVDLDNVTHAAVLTPGVDYDQIQVNGDLFINGATLAGTFNTLPGSDIQAGNTFTIAQTSGGTVHGRFAEPFGPGIAFINGQKFTVDYSDNTKVVLTKVLSNITSMTVSSSPNPSTLRQPIQLTANITPETGAGAIPSSDTVTFTFTDTTNPLIQYTGTVPVQSGNTATFNTNTDLIGQPFLPGGTYTVTAAFSGDSVNFMPANANLPGTQTVEVPIFDVLTGVPADISPNQSLGIQDSLALNTTVLKERGSLNWTFTIRDSSNVVIQTLPGIGGTGGPHTSVPISTIWNGKTSGGTFAPNGDYTVTATFTDQFGNTGTSNTISVVVDNTNPTATPLANSHLLIAPGTGLSVPGSTDLTSTVGDPSFTGHPTGNFDHWTITIRDINNIVVKTFTGTGDGAIDATWDGTDSGGVNIVPDGAYTASITAFDAAGNSFSPAPNQTIVVLTHPPTVTLSSNTPTVYGDTITLTSTVTLPAGIPNSIVDLLSGDEVDFYRDGSTFLGSGTLSSAVSGGPYTTTITVPTFNAGTYPSMFASYVGTTNFLPGTSAPHTHVVTPKDLTITASNTVTKVYGDPVPALNLASGYLTVTGLTNGDTAANVVTGSAATTATQASHVIVGGYPITVGTLAVNSNYHLIFQNGTLTVTKAPLTVTIDNKSRPIHSANPPFTFTASPLLLGDPASVVTGLNLATSPATDVNSPIGSYPIVATGTPTAQDYNIINIVNGVLQITPIPTSVLIGPGAGGGPVVQAYTPGGLPLMTFTPFNPSFNGGIRVASGDFNRDGVLDYAFGTGPGTVASVRVISGATGADLFDTQPFGGFTGGVFVSAGDVNHDGADDLVVTPDEGGGPRVIVYSGMTFSPMISYFGINDPSFRGGARAAVGDLNGDGFAEIAVSAGFQGGPRVSIWDGKALSSLHFQNVVPDFFVFDQSLRNGAYLAIGDVNGDGLGDLIAGAGPGGGPHVKVISGADILNPAIGPSNAVPFASFFAGDPNNRGGVRVAVKSFDNDLKADIITGVGDNGGDTATAYLGANLAVGDTDPYFALDPFPGFMNGVFVG